MAQTLDDTDSGKIDSERCGNSVQVCREGICNGAVSRLGGLIPENSLNVLLGFEPDLLFHVAKFISNSTQRFERKPKVGCNMLQRYSLQQRRVVFREKKITLFGTLLAYQKQP